MAANKVQADAKAKAKRQKIILAVLGVVFLGVLAWQVPSVLKIMNKKPPVAATTPPAAVVPGTPVPPVSGTPVSAIRRRGPVSSTRTRQLSPPAASSSRSTAFPARTRSSSRLASPPRRPRRLRTRPGPSRSG